MSDSVVDWICIGSIIILFICVIKLLLAVGKINTSIAKLGFVIREDAKKYFDDAAQSIVDTNEKFQDKYTLIVQDGTKSALKDTNLIAEEVLSKAHHDAGDIILQAREESRRIIEEAKNESVIYQQRALDQSTATIQWVIEQFAGKTIEVEQHEALIRVLVDQYINESRSQ